MSFKGDKKAKKKKKKTKHKKEKVTEEKISSSFPDEEDEDLTPAERKALKRKQLREKEELEKVAQKSHRERIEEFNEKLGSLTEHNDIPRVSIHRRGYGYVRNDSAANTLVNRCQLLETANNKGQNEVLLSFLCYRRL